MINGDRVKQARELRGWTQDALAQRLHKTQSAIAQIEGGSYGASDELIDAIANETGLPLAFFEKETAPDLRLGSLKFCAHVRTTSREKIEAYRHAQLTYEIFRFLNAQLRSTIPVDLEKLSEDDPFNAARLTRQAINLSADEPVPHLLNILEHHGTTVLTFPPLNKREAFSVWHDGFPIIAISDGRPGDSLRLTCAHELGHLVMHSKKLAFKVNDSEADQFAVEFLMPSKAMRRELKPPITLTLLGDLKVRWKVPMKALIRRAKELHIISERQYRYLFEQIAIKGWDEHEPEKLRPERARGLRQFAEMIYGNPIDYKRLADDVCLNPEMVSEIMERYAPRKRGAASGEEQDLPMPRKVVELRKQPD
jgi:Zn-dependent peptidase ImmA (M78 family)/DNA-binding XRE family transcriptional regulator